MATQALRTLAARIPAVAQWRQWPAALMLLTLSAAQAGEPGASAPKLDLQYRRDGSRPDEAQRELVTPMRESLAQRERERERLRNAEPPYGVGYEARMAARLNAAGGASPDVGMGGAGRGQRGRH